MNIDNTETDLEVVSSCVEDSNVPVPVTVTPDGLLFDDLRRIVHSSRRRIAVSVVSESVSMYWQVGCRIKRDILKNGRGTYGDETVKKCSDFLTLEFGSGWGYQTVRHCVRAAYTFTEAEIVYAMRTQLSWTHLRTVMSISDELKRMFYIEMAAHEHWGTRQLADKVDALLYERTAISRRPENVIRAELTKAGEKGELSPDLVFRSSYFFSLTGLKDEYSESDLENAILAQIETAIEELGSDFAFLGRQRRITIDATDYKMDLLFFHRSLRRLVVVDLKLGRFKPEYEGQMRLYLRYLDRNDRKTGEESPIGLILCSEGNTEHIEYLMLDEGDIRVAQFFTQLPSKELLRVKLQRAVAIARASVSERVDMGVDMEAKP